MLMPPRRSVRLRLFDLEARLAPSTSIPLNPTSWTEMGPSPIVNAVNPAEPVAAGRVTAIAPHPTNPNIVYIGAAGGGVWRTTNATAANPDWTPLTDAQKTLFIGALAVAPSDPNVVYAGTGEATNSFVSYAGHGLLKSTDGGTNWTLLGAAPFDGRSISRIAVHPTDPNTLYVATSWGANGVGGYGVWKSTDGGTAWTNTTAGITTSASFSDVAVNPNTPATVWCAAGWSSGHGKNGVYRSDDAGATWTLQTGLPSGSAVGRIGIALAPSTLHVVYVSMASASSNSLHSLWRAVPGGWSNRTPTIDYMVGLGDYAQAIAVDPTDFNTVYVGGGAATASTKAILQTTDGGVNWTPISREGPPTPRPHRFQQAMAFDAAGKLLEGTDGGIWRLDNPAVGQILWADKNGRGETGLAITQFNGIALHPTDPDVAFGGTQGGFGRFTDAGVWTTSETSEGFDSGEVIVDPDAPTTAYRISPNYSTFGLNPATYLRKSTDGGTTWTPITTGIVNPSGSTYYPPLVMDPGNSLRLMTGSDAVSVTTNGGASWAQLGTFTFPGAIDDIAIARTAGSTVYVSTYGRLWATTNNGAVWTERSIPGSTYGSFDLEVDPTDASVVYAVRNVFVGSASKHVFRSTNGGANWTDISGNLPDLPVWSLQLIDRGPGTADDLLVVGTDDGVYRSANLGGTWTRFATGLPNVQVRDLEFAPDARGGPILAAGTNGRGLWEILLGTPGAGNADSFQVTEDTPYNMAVPGVLGNDTDVDGHSLTADLVSGPAHAAAFTFRPDGSFSYTPAANYDGPDSFTYRPNDGSGGSTVVTVSLIVRAVNDLPIATDDTVATPAGKALTVNVLGNDTDVDGDPLRVGSFTAPAHGRVTRSGSGLRYTPTAGYQGADAFGYTVLDGHGGVDTGVVNLTVVDTTRPTVAGVRVGYANTSQDLRGLSRTVLPWADVRRFEFVFSEGVAVDPAALTLTGPAGPVALTFTPAGGNRTAVWEVPEAGLAIGRYTLQLNAGLVADLNGNVLAGRFARAVGLLPGDFDGNGVVNALDVSGIRKNFQTNPAKANRFADVNGDGVVDQADVDLAAENLTRRI